MAFCKAVSMFSPPNSVMILEVPLNTNERCAGEKCKLPHGNIDKVIVSPGVDTTSNVGVLILDGETNLATSMKNQSTGAKDIMGLVTCPQMQWVCRHGLKGKHL